MKRHSTTNEQESQVVSYDRLMPGELRSTSAPVGATGGSSLAPGAREAHQNGSAEEEVLLQDGGAAAVAIEPDAQTEAEPQIKTGALAGKSLTAGMIMIAWPVLLSQLMGALIALCDQILTGHLPAAIRTPALDGVGIGGYVGWFVNVAMAAIGVGGSAIISRAMGAGRKEESHTALAQTLLFALIWGFGVGIILWTATPAITTLGNLSPEASEFCTQYIRTLCLGMPFSGLMFVAIMCLNSAGESRKTFFVLLAVNIINAVASWILSGVDFVLGSRTLHNPFPFELGVRGIAGGTAIAETCGALMITGVMLHGIKDLKLDWHRLRPDFALLTRVVRIGVPNFLEGIGMWLGQMLGVLHIIGLIAVKEGRDNGLLGAHSIAVRWEAFSYLPGMALGVAAGSLAGQYLGAGNKKMAQKAIWMCTLAGMTIMGLVGIALIFGGPMLTRLISDDPVHLDYVPRILTVAGFVQVFFAMAMVISNALRRVGDTHVSMGITIFNTWCVRVPLAYIIGYKMEYGLMGVWYALCFELVLRGCLFMGRFLQGKWMHVRV